MVRQPGLYIHSCGPAQFGQATRDLKTHFGSWRNGRVFVMLASGRGFYEARHRREYPTEHLSLQSHSLPSRHCELKQADAWCHYTGAVLRLRHRLAAW